MLNKDGSYPSYLGDVTMVDQDSFSFRVLIARTFSDPALEPVSSRRTHLEDIVCDDIKSVSFLNKMVRIRKTERMTKYRGDIVENLKLLLVTGD